MFSRIGLTVLAAPALGMGLFASSTMAGSLDLVDPATGASSGWRAVWDSPNVSLSVDAIVGDTIFIEKFAQFTTNETISITFEQTSVDAVSKIAINDEQVVNQTSSTWVGFVLDIDNGTTGSGNDAEFDPAASGIGEPDGFSINPFTTFNFSDSNQTLTVGGGTVADGEIWFPGVDSGELYIISAAPTVSGTLRTFVLNETPIIPLPPAALMGLSTMGGLGLVGGVIRYRRRSR